MPVLRHSRPTLRRCRGHSRLVPCPRTRVWLREAAAQRPHEGQDLGRGRRVAPVGKRWHRPACGTAVVASLTRVPVASLIQSLVSYNQPSLAFTDYPPHRAKGHAIGMIEATVKRVIAQGLKSYGMHWFRDGATAITALRAPDLNGHSHQFSRNLPLTT